MTRRLIPLLLLLLPLTGCMTPLMKAAGKGQTETVKRLLDQGADVNEVSVGSPALEFAAKRGDHPKTVKLLLEHGANIDFQSPATFRTTALMWAAMWGHLRSVRVLLNYGADTKLKNKSGKTAEMIALSSGYPETARLIREGELKQRKRAKVHAAQALLDSKMPAIRAYTTAGDKARKAGDKAAALKNYLAALGEAPPGTEIERELREKTITFVGSWKPAPKVSRQARRHFNRAMGLVKMAKDASGYEKAIEELEQALVLAPWWAEAYFNLGLVQEKAKKFGPAIGSMRAYLMAKPDAKDAVQVESKIDQLELAQEMAN